MFDERREVLLALAQRGDAQRRPRHTVKQVLAETARGHSCTEVLVGGGHQPEPDFSRLAVSEGIYFPPVEHAKEVGLELERHFPDLVEEQGSPGGRLDLANRAGAPGPRERALDIAEQLARENVARQAAAVQRHEAAVLAVPTLVDRPGKHLFADPGLTLQQHGDIEVRQLPRLLDDQSQGRAATDDLAKAPIRLVTSLQRRDVRMSDARAGSPLERV